MARKSTAKRKTPEVKQFRVFARRRFTFLGSGTKRELERVKATWKKKGARVRIIRVSPGVHLFYAESAFVENLPR